MWAGRRPLRGRRSGRTRGAAALELAIITPVLLLLLLAVAQAAAAEQAHQVALAAAQRGARAARVSTGSDAAGRAAVHDAIAGLGPTLVVDPAVTVRRTAGSVRVEVVATAPSVVPFLHLPIDEVAEGPVEQLTSAGTAP